MMSKKRKNKSKKSRSHNKFLIVFVGLLIVSVIGVGSFFGFRYLYNDHQFVDKTDGPSALYSKAVDLITKDGYEAGQQYLDRQLEGASNNEDKAEIYITKAEITINNRGSGEVVRQDNSSALKYYYEAEKLYPTAITAMSIASLEEEAGNKVNAAKYYKLYLDRSTGLYEDYRQYLETVIERLESDYEQ